METYSPACLRHGVTTSVPEGFSATNFGISKGLTFERVLIFPTGSIKKFLNTGTILAPKSACGLYVGSTRAIHSVAFVMDNPEKSMHTVWTPDV
jgi:hypothetical protein